MRGRPPYSPATIEALAASIKAKGVLQPPVVEVERDGEGVPTGNYLVTIGDPPVTGDGWPLVAMATMATAAMPDITPGAARPPALR